MIRCIVPTAWPCWHSASSLASFGFGVEPMPPQTRCPPWLHGHLPLYLRFDHRPTPYHCQPCTMPCLALRDEKSIRPFASSTNRRTPSTSPTLHYSHHVLPLARILHPSHTLSDARAQGAGHAGSSQPARPRQRAGVDQRESRALPAWMRMVVEAKAVSSYRRSGALCVLLKAGGALELSKERRRSVRSKLQHTNTLSCALRPFTEDERQVVRSPSFRSSRTFARSLSANNLPALHRPCSTTASRSASPSLQLPSRPAKKVASFVALSATSKLYVLFAARVALRCLGRTPS